MRVVVGLVVVCLAILWVGAIAGEIKGSNPSADRIAMTLPRTITYQGVLEDSSGDPVRDSTYAITFRIYDSPVPVGAIWQVVDMPVGTINGCFAVQLGPIDLPFDIAYYISLQIQGDQEMQPQKMTMAPYAASADRANFSFESDTADYARNAAFADTADYAWAASVPASGWIDAGSIVRLNTSSDSVGIGTSTPGEKLEIAGNIRVSGKANIGPNNTNTGLNAFVAGENSSATGDNSTVGGGINNTVSTADATVGGGRSNTASGLGSVIAGGYAGIASNENATIGGGWHSVASGIASTVAGGMQDTAGGTYSAISGGYKNAASEWGSAVGGGESNKSRGLWSVVPGGFGNQALGLLSMAAGYGSTAGHDGSFVWSDLNGGGASTSGNQFIIRASAGVGIGTNNPTAALEVNGTAKSVVSGVEFYMVPRGAIIMWSGTLASIPSGWALCDGSNGTPDLGDRFIFGCHSGDEPGVTGGSETHGHTVTLPQTIGGFGAFGAPPGTFPTTISNHLPPYYKLAFIMKL